MAGEVYTLTEVPHPRLKKIKHVIQTFAVICVGVISIYSLFSANQTASSFREILMSHLCHGDLADQALVDQAMTEPNVTLTD